MGSVRTEQIKRIARELVRHFPDKFSHDFENNKHMVDTLIRGATTKVRNQIAGYITSTFAGIETTSSSNESKEESK
ncbi:30S ribosomal protein S17e [Candidatus Bathyarchaeota archaeon]|nr:30S ribosomal protein S17e [Candidatus Bathyarchaeota archaeon]